MSTLKVTNIQATGETASRAVSGVAAAMAHISADGATVSSSYNVSSIDDDGTGDRGVNLTSSMGGASYIVNLTSDDGASGAQTRQCDTTNSTMASGTFDFECYFVNSSNNRTNVDAINYVSVHGDLA